MTNPDGELEKSGSPFDFAKTANRSQIRIRVALLGIPVVVFLAVAAAPFLRSLTLPPSASEADGFFIYASWFRCGLADLYQIHAEHVWPRGYARLVALIPGSPYIAGKCVSLAAGAMCVAMTSCLASLWFEDRRSVLITSLLVAVSGPLITYSTLASTDMLFTALILAAVTSAFAGLRNSSSRRFVVSGMLTALSMTARYQTAVIFASLTVAIWIATRSDARQARSSVSSYVGSFAVAVLALRAIGLLDFQQLLVFVHSAPDRGVGSGIAKTLSFSTTLFLVATGLLAAPVSAGFAVNLRRRAFRFTPGAWIVIFPIAVYSLAVSFFPLADQWEARRWFLPAIPLVATGVASLIRVRDKGPRTLAPRVAVMIALAIWAVGQYGVEFGLQHLQPGGMLKLPAWQRAWFEARGSEINLDAGEWTEMSAAADFQSRLGSPCPLVVTDSISATTALELPVHMALTPDRAEQLQDIVNAARGDRVHVLARKADADRTSATVGQIIGVSVRRDVDDPIFDEYEIVKNPQ